MIFASLGLLLESAAALGADKHNARFTLHHEGVPRTYQVHVPPAYDARHPLPVVMYIHGGGGNARSAYLDGLDKAADRFGFLLAIPEGTGERRRRQLRASWNGGTWAGGSCCTSADDVGFIARMLDDLEKNFAVDRRRVYAAGISNGGLMTNRLGCELANRLAAIATVAPAAIPSDCHPARLLPVMDIHGTADTCNPYEGGPPTNPLCRKVSYTRMSPAAVRQAWLTLNRCAPESDITYQAGNATCWRHAQCAPGAEVVFCRVEGMGHAWPSGFQSKLLGIAPVSHDISTDQLWDFFRQHALPEPNTP